MTNFSRAFAEPQGKVLYHPAFGQEPVVNPRRPRRLPEGVIAGDFRRKPSGPGLRIVMQEVRA
ncbi:hypothetical protein C7440_1068 [Pusillimonas noertemannii]|uniref:Uncharacterized protein n=1 Tax=Pusillimonas noertemannii TaxID=305977 RepID=A0A2U1CRY0_9BURK|nr:hypothetical protein C7440_1068 [Pusillimonas noertemannii]